jgi:hypothetical protein
LEFVERSIFIAAAPWRDRSSAKDAIGSAERGIGMVNDWLRVASDDRSACRASACGVAPPTYNAARSFPEVSHAATARQRPQTPGARADGRHRDGQQIGLGDDAARS